MRTTFKPFYLPITFLIFLFASYGCTEVCSDLICKKGEPISGPSGCECFCDAGYEGTYCDRKMNGKFVGRYQSVPDCNAQLLWAGDDVVINQGIHPAQIVLTNFAGNDINIIGRISTDGHHFTIVSQTYQTRGQIVGEGTLDPVSGVIAVDYRITFPGGSGESCVVRLRGDK